MTDTLQAQTVGCNCEACQRRREEEAKPTYELLTPKLPAVKEPSRRLFSVQQIVNAVINYEHGCGPGKRDWLQRMLGIRLDGSNRPTGEVDGNIVKWKLQYEIEVNLDRYREYYGGNPEAVEVRETTAPYLRQRYSGQDLPAWLSVRQTDG